MKRKVFKARLSVCTNVGITHSRHVIEDKYDRAIIKRKDVEDK